MLFTAAQVAEAVGGDLVAAAAGAPPSSISGVSIDTRTINAGELFVPVVAERNGHEYIASAVDAGASLYLSAQGVVDDRADCVLVPDTEAALLALGAAARDRMIGPVIGITGSVGKTSVKDLTAAACSAKTVHANPASFNNELGLPLTLVNAPDDVEITVVEMGSRGIGHIASLCKPARPTIGVVTRVAAAHTELFGSLEQVAEAKGELIAALPADGVAVLNADDARVAAMAVRSAARVMTFGSSGADVGIGHVVLDDLLRPRFTLHTPDGQVELQLRISGAHMAGNAAAAVAAALAAGVSLEAAASGVSRGSLSPMRMELVRLSSGATVINDAYNANPTSMGAALDALSSMDATRRIAIVGVMAELGQGEAEAHREIASKALHAGIEVVAVDAPWYGTDHPPHESGVVHVETAEAAAESIGSVGEGTAILVKGSRVAGLERLIGML